MTADRMKHIVLNAIETTFAKIEGGRICCESEATIQLHLAQLLQTFGDVELVAKGEAFSLELEKQVWLDGKKAEIDILCCLHEAGGEEFRCAIELKFFKKSNQREPNNRADVFKDLRRLENYGSNAQLGFMLVATDHPHYFSQGVYSSATMDFNFTHGSNYVGGTKLTYRTDKPHCDPITLQADYDFRWRGEGRRIRHLIVEVIPTPKMSTAN